MKKTYNSYFKENHFGFRNVSRNSSQGPFTHGTVTSLPNVKGYSLRLFVFLVYWKSDGSVEKGGRSFSELGRTLIRLLLIFYK